MKTMFMFDLLTATKMLKSQVVLSVVVAVIFGVSTDMPLAIIPFMALMLAYATGFTLCFPIRLWCFKLSFPPALTEPLPRMRYTP